MAEDILAARGLLDLFAAGILTPEDQAYVLTPTREQILAGWPDWHPRATDPIDSPFDGYLHWDAGTAGIYDGNPILLHLSGPFVLGEKGYIANIVSEHRGTFEDFAIYEYDTGTQVLGDDPVQGFVQADNDGALSGSGDITSAWTRHYRVMYPPKRARYAVPHLLLGSLGAGKSTYLDAFQSETLPLSAPAAPTAWVPPRQIKVRVMPTRLNYSINPSFAVSTDGTLTEGDVTLTRDTGFAWTGQASLKVEVDTTAGSVRVEEDQDIPVAYGENLAVSVYAYVPVTLSGSYPMAVRFYTIAGVLVDTQYGSIIHDRTQVGWDRQTVLTTVPEGADLARVSLASSDTAPASADTFYLDGVLIEKAPTIQDYFDGSTNEDCLWKQGGTPGLTWSYFYEDRVKRHYILERTLRENVPLGVSITDPEYAAGFTWLTSYGYGAYGSGPYGG